MLLAPFSPKAPSRSAPPCLCASVLKYLLFSFELAELAAFALVGRVGPLEGRTIDALETAHLTLRLGHRRRRVGVKGLGLGLGHVPFGQGCDDNRLLATV